MKVTTQSRNTDKAITFVLNKNLCDFAQPYDLVLNEVTCTTHADLSAMGGISRLRCTVIKDYDKLGKAAISVAGSVFTAKKSDLYRRYTFVVSERKGFFSTLLNSALVGISKLLFLDKEIGDRKENHYILETSYSDNILSIDEMVREIKNHLLTNQSRNLAYG